VASFFNRLLHKKSSSVANVAESQEKPDLPSPVVHNQSIGLTEIQLATISHAQPHLETAQLVVGVGQSAGIERDHNEDSIFTLTTSLLIDDKSFNFGLYIVADGMGGHDNGEIASRLAVNGVATHVINNLYLPLISTSHVPYEYSLHEVMKAGVLQTHQIIKKETDGGGTTLTAALILGDQLTITHIGDSRAYYIDPLGKLKLMTRDHSLVKRLEEVGQISAEQALTDPRRNVLYRALGQGEPFEPDIASMQVCNGCQLLICSDGLWGVISEEDLTTMIVSSMEPQFVCQTLVQAANQAGGPDNISVILVRLPG
jgi:serine/threonine protein phosphatase PrpC